MLSFPPRPSKSAYVHFSALLRNEGNAAFVLVQGK